MRPNTITLLKLLVCLAAVLTGNILLKHIGCSERAQDPVPSLVVTVPDQLVYLTK